MDKLNKARSQISLQPDHISLNPVSHTSSILSPPNKQDQSPVQKTPSTRQIPRNSPLYHSKILDRLAATERESRKNEKLKDLQALKSLSQSIQSSPKHLAELSPKTRRFKLELLDLETDPQQLIPDESLKKLSASNPRYRFSHGSSDYHLMKNFLTTRTLADESSFSEIHLTSLTKANLEKYKKFLDASNRAEGRAACPGQPDNVKAGAQLPARKKERTGGHQRDKVEQDLIEVRERVSNVIELKQLEFMYLFIYLREKPTPARVCNLLPLSFENFE